MSAPESAANVVGLRFELFVRDVAVTVGFYEATVGLTPPEGWSSSGHGYVPLRSGPVTIGVQTADGLHAGHHFSPERLAGPRGAGVEIVLEVDDIDRAYAMASPRADALGGACEPLRERPWGTRDFRLIDPDGYYVRVTSVRGR